MASQPAVPANPGSPISPPAPETPAAPGSQAAPGNLPPTQTTAAFVAPFDCPTVQAPEYGTEKLSALSPTFQSTCATCHGAAGQGFAAYPAVPGTLTLAKYIDTVRKGTANMPPFAASLISDTQLTSDFNELRRRGNATVGATAVSGPQSWTQAQVDQAYTRGLAAWRKPGAVDGLACSNCHSPDAVELAMIGFPDHAILRRGLTHASVDDVLAIRDLVHAQRRRFGLTKTCSTDWRPFQPGGQVLAGNTPEEQDASLLAELTRRNVLLATGKVVSLQDARKALAELQAIDLRTMPIGVPLPRWSEDKFNGPEHRDVNDYMPAVATVPNDPVAYHAKVDAYLAKADDTGLYALLDLDSNATNDAGFSAKNARLSQPNSNCFGFPTTTTWYTNTVNGPKRRSVLVASHIFRQELLKRGSWVARAESVMSTSPELLNPMFKLGGLTVEPPCYDNLNAPGWTASMPEGFRAEMPQRDLDNKVIQNTSDRMTHPWMMLGQVFDQPTRMVEPMVNNKMHYWADRNFSQRQVNLPFVFAHRLAMQLKVWEREKATGRYAKANNGDFGINPLVNPMFMYGGQLEAGLKEADSGPNATTINTFKGNLIRMKALLALDALNSGQPIGEIQNNDHCLSAICAAAEMTRFTDELAGRANAAGFDTKLYVTDTRALLNAMIAALEKAPRR